jgi:DNA polymerase-3 subunit gamma/tau
MAKLLACALNAEGGPRVDFEPEAAGCRAIMNGTSLDVVEMDAASNNSVDDIRELRENVALAPMGGGRRVYILDEAHMLSTSAWNAFLKTLEEPPPHVVFVLATTEAHKVPATIVDRCHRFDFHRPTLQQIADVLRRVAGEEDIELPDPAVGMIARSATGSFRDALGTLEQLVTYGGREVKLDDVLEILGVADAELVLEAADSLVDHDPKAALLAVEKLSASGRDMTQFMRDLAGHLRHLFVVQTLGSVPDSFSVTAEHTDRLSAQGDRLAQGEILRAVDLLAAALAAVKDGSDPRIQLEMALLKAVQPQADLSLQALLFRIEQLERRVQQGGASAPAAPAAPEPAAAAPAGSPRPTPGGSAAGGSTTGPPVAKAVARESAGAGDAAATVAAAVAPEVVEEEAVQADAAPVDLEQLRTLWPAAVDSVCEQNQMVGAFLKGARAEEIEAGRLTIAFAADAGFAKKKVETNRALLQQSLRTLTGASLELRFELRDGHEEDDPGERLLSGDELFERLKSEFGGTEVFDEEPS